MVAKYIIGIDLHGTLLDEQWEIKKGAKKKLISSLELIKDFCKIYICSGNDLSFIEKYVPKDIGKYFDGYILETGCVISDGKREEIIIPKDQIRIIKDLEGKLKESAPKEIKYFARRMITISMFTKDEHGGDDPVKIYKQVQKLVDDLGFGDKVLVTHSNVAIDIIPKGFNKFSGMKYVAGKSGTIGIADSLNDSHMILNADYSFVPANVSSKLINLLGKKKRNISNASAEIAANGVMKSKHDNTLGVVDALKYIHKNLRV